MPKLKPTPPALRKPWTEPRLQKLGTIADVAGNVAGGTETQNTRS